MLILVLLAFVGFGVGDDLLNCVNTQNISQLEFGGDESYHIINCGGLCFNDVTCFNILYGLPNVTAVWDCRLDDWSIMSRAVITCSVCNITDEENIDPSTCFLDMKVGSAFLPFSGLWAWFWIAALVIIVIVNTRYYYVSYII